MKGKVITSLMALSLVLGQASNVTYATVLTELPQQESEEIVQEQETPVVEESDKETPIVEESDKETPVVEESDKETPVVEESDKEAPVLKSVTIVGKEAGKTPEVKPGETIKVVVKASDASGLGNGVITFEHEGSGQTLSAVLRANGEELVGYLTLNNVEKAGIWKVLAVGIKDKEGNSQQYTKESSHELFANGTFNVVGEYGLVDIFGPAFQSVTVSSNTAMPNQQVDVIVNAKDESGMMYGIVNYINIETGDSIEVELMTLLPSGKWKGNFRVTPNLRNGKYVISSIELIDELGNTSYITKKAGQPNPFEQAFIEVKGNNSDITKPYIATKAGEKVSDKLSVSQKEATVGEEVFFTIKGVTDNESDIGYVVALIKNTISNVEEIIEFEEVESGVYVGAFEVTDQTHNGVWNVTDLEIGDESGNSVLYYGEDVKNLTFEVKGANGDTQAPSYKGITVNNSDVFKPGETVTFDVSLDDTTDIEEAALLYVSPYNQQLIAIPLKAKGDGTSVTGEYKIQGYSQSGVYKAAVLYVRDKNGNELFEESLDNADFQVIETTSDEEAPIIHDVKIEGAKTLKVGEKLHVTVDAEDSYSGVDEVLVAFGSESIFGEEMSQTALSLQIGNPYIQMIELDYNEATKKYEADFTVTPDMAVGMWSFFTAVALDKAGNDTFYETDDIFTFEVVQDVVKTIELYTDKEEVVAGDQVAVIAQLGDKYKETDLAFVEFFHVGEEDFEDFEDVEDMARFSTQLGTEDYQELMLQYDEEADAHVGILTVTEEMLEGDWLLTNVRLQDEIMVNVSAWNNMFHVGSSIEDDGSDDEDSDTDNEGTDDKVEDNEGPDDNSSTPSTDNENDKGNAPQTGDDMNFILYGSTLLGASGLLLLLARIRMRK